ncbi:MAG TPA: redox-regulated ATPase YchF [Candidatus Paceibacterota bacterium]
MKLSIGIVGLPNVGKSTLFKALTNIEINIANYPFATIDPNVGVVAVPDERLQKLAEMSKSEKIIPAVVEFYDIAGLVKGANKGEGLGNQFLTHIRDVQAIVQVVRVFGGSEIIHVEQIVDPIRDIEIINTELILKDLDTVEKRLQKLEGEARSGDKEKKKDLEIVNQIKKILEEGKLLFTLSAEVLESLIMREMNLLTGKKQIYLLNGDEGDVSDDLKAKIKELGADYIVADLSTQQHSNILQNVGMLALIKKAYEVLGLISFFTTGEKETRAWTIKRGSLAPEAAGAIHSDFEKKFIRAEVIGWDKLLEAGGWAKAKQKGWLRLEGKDYVFQDGDVTEIRHG